MLHSHLNHTQNNAKFIPDLSTPDAEVLAVGTLSSNYGDRCMPSIRLLVLAPTTLFALGCVPQSQYDSLLMANNTLEEIIW